MFSVAVCDDDEILCTQFEKILDLYGSKEIETTVFYSGEKLYEALSGGEHYDLIFLDIELQKQNGVDIGKKIRDELDDQRVQIVYISAKQEYAMELFDIRPMNFLIKPISKNAVTNAIEKAIVLTDQYDSCFTFSFGAGKFRIPYGNILYFESVNRKIKVHTKRGMKELYGKLNEIEEQCPVNFIRIHQSYLINRFYVTYWQGEEVTISDEITLPISKGYQKKVAEFLICGERK